MFIDVIDGREYQNFLSDVPNIYPQEVVAIELESLKRYFDNKQDTALADIIDKIKLPKSSKVYFSQFITLLKVSLVLLAINAVVKNFECQA